MSARPGAVLGRALIFSVALTLAFTAFTYVLPQIQGEAPKDEAVKLEGMTMEAFVALGREVYFGKGSCNLCHNALDRAPDIERLDMVKTSAERLADPRYQGQAKDAEGYLRESLLQPDAFVVGGYGKVGSNDTISPMPAVDKPPSQLKPAEVDAVIAYMQAKDGHPVTVPLPSAAPTTEAAPAGPAQTAEEALVRHGCQACHSVLGVKSEVGPSLEGVGARLSADEIRQAIVDPDAVIAAGYSAGVMPTDYAQRLTVAELELLVRFLAEQ